MTVLRVTTLDARQLTSRVEVVVPSLRVALRLARLPAIRTLVLYDDSDKKRRNTPSSLRLPD